MKSVYSDWRRNNLKIYSNIKFLKLHPGYLIEGRWKYILKKYLQYNIYG